MVISWDGFTTSRYKAGDIIKKEHNLIDGLLQKDIVMELKADLEPLAKGGEEGLELTIGDEIETNQGVAVVKRIYKKTLLASLIESEEEIKLNLADVNKAT